MLKINKTLFSIHHVMENEVFELRPVQHIICGTGQFPEWVHMHCLRDIPELSSLTSDDMAFVTESAATSKSFRKLRTLLVLLAGGCWPNACRTSPLVPSNASAGELTL